MSDVKLPNAINLVKERKKMRIFLLTALTLTLLAFTINDFLTISGIFSMLAHETRQLISLVMSFTLFAISVPYYFHFMIRIRMGTSLKLVNDSQLEALSSYIQTQPQLQPLFDEIKSQGRIPVNAEYDSVHLYIESKEPPVKIEKTRGIELWESL